MIKKIRYILAIAALFSANVEISYSQNGGSGVYTFLKLTSSARSSALGGNHTALYNSDLSMVANNPALLNSSMHNRFNFNFVSHYAGIGFGSVAYAYDFKKTGMFALNIRYINYGDFIGADERGVITGTFTASEYAFEILWAKKITDRISGGINIKPIYSQFEKYNSFGLVGDLGLTYFNEKSNFTASFTVADFGYQLTSYTGTNREPVDYDVRLGLSQKLAHAPFRFNLLFHTLQKWDLTYETPQEFNNTLTDASGTVERSSFVNFLDNGMRHVTFGIEILPVKAFYLAAGYNYKLRQELKTPEKSGMTGFSFGFGLTLKKFGLSYSNSTWHLAGKSHQFSFYLNFDAFKKKGEEIKN